MIKNSTDTQSPQIPPSKTTSKPLMLGIVVGCGLLLAISLWFGQNWLAQQNNSPLFAPQAGCQLPQQSCLASDGAHSIRFSIDSEELSSHQPLPLQVWLEGFNPSQVTVKLQGVEMYMGENNATLQLQSDGSYRTDIQLPACTTGTMLWRAQILITETGGMSGSWFDFEAR
ncbi:MAG: hypothetical protein V7707_18355 [Motiliproteus sp.]